MIIQKRRLAMTSVRILKCLPSFQTFKNTIWICNRRSNLSALCGGSSHCELQGLHCERNGAMWILSLHTLHVSLPKIQLGQLHHHCSNAKSQASSIHYPSLTMHRPPRRSRYPILLKTRRFPNTKRLRLR